MQLPTRKELSVLLENIDAKTFMLLARVLQLPEGDDVALPYAFVLRFSLYDWLMAFARIDAEDRQRLLLAFSPDLEVVASQYENDPRRVILFTLLDYRWACLLQPNQAKFFDLKTDAWTNQHHANVLTMLHCDLGVLMQRLLNKLERSLKLKVVAPVSRA